MPTDFLAGILDIGTTLWYKRHMKILVLGFTQAGKSLAAIQLAEILGSQPPITSSDVIIRDYAKASGYEEQFVRVSKATYRKALYLFGNVMESDNPAYPADEILKQTDVLAGIRNPSQLAAIRDQLDLIIWISRPGCVAGETDKIGPEVADVIIANDGTLDELRVSLQRILALYFS